MNKTEILKNLNESRQQFMDAIAGLSEADMQQPGVVGEWSIKDLIAHITLWEAELIKLLWELEQGRKPSGIFFSGKPVDTINAHWFQENRNRSLAQVLADFEGARKQTIRRVETLSDRDLNDPHYAPALAAGDPYPLFGWIEDNTFGHEAEHAAEISAWRKQNSK